MLGLCLVASALVTTIDARNSYVVVLLSAIRPGLPISISVNILQATGDTKVTVELLENGNQSLAHGSSTIKEGEPGLVSLKVPSRLKSGFRHKIVVTGSGGANFTNETVVNLKYKSISLFVLTDKATYKPGQTVNFRVFAMYPDLKVFHGSFNVDIYDPNSNKIKQMRNIQDSSGVITSKLELSDQPVLGDWKIKVSADGQTSEKIFTVAEYVLPRFKVSVILPSFALSSDAEVRGTITAVYTYGKSVKGNVHIRAKLDSKFSREFKGRPPVFEQTIQMQSDSTSFTIPMKTFTSGSPSLNGRKMYVRAKVTESLTGNTLNGSNNIRFYNSAVKINFFSSNPKTFKPGLPYIAYLNVEQRDGTPVLGSRQSLRLVTSVTYNLPGQDISRIFPRTGQYKLHENTFNVPDTGIVPLKMKIPKNATQIHFKAFYDKVSSSMTLKKSWSPSNSYIQLFLKTRRPKAGSNTSIRVLSTSTVESYTYQVLSRGSIVAAGSVIAGSSNHRFSIPITSQMAPHARIVVYHVRADGEIVADSISFETIGTFENKVDIRFNKVLAEPGEIVKVRVSGTPHSSVNLLAVDQSVLLLKSGNDVTESQIIDELKSYDTIVVPQPPIINFANIRKANGNKKFRFPRPYPVFYGGSDATDIFDNAGVLVMTDALLYDHYEPRIWRAEFFRRGNIAQAPRGGVPGRRLDSPSVAKPKLKTLKSPKAVRKVFPETWLWINETIGADGSVTVSTTMPDTITSWVASAFAVSSSTGVGVAPTTAKVTGFRPFFVSLNLPYSVVRGEQVVIQANLFNYLKEDLDVLVTFENSSEYDNVIIDSSTGTERIASETRISTVHVLANSASSVYLAIVPKVIGSILLKVMAQSSAAADAVERLLIVEAEGVEHEYNTPILIEMQEKSTFFKSVPIDLPPGVVTGSQKAQVTVVGDLMGASINNLDNLLKMPYGCGEQNMINFAPNIYVSKYLTTTNQMTGAIQDKANRFMEAGYQRELTYQHKDGSFSAFGDSDPSGSMWLTAFVVKSFHQAKPFIFIDDGVIIRAINWMISKQNRNGSFPEPGRVIHKAMQGGSANGPALTAFVMIALLENSDIGGSIEQRISGSVALALDHLEGPLGRVADDYTMSISAYALSLAASSAADTVLARLETRAVVKDGLKHWHKPVSLTPTIHHYWQPPHSSAPAIDIEMTSYVLLVYSQNKQTIQGLPVMKWILLQRNRNGGFVSTQDTVVALQALTDMAALVYSNDFNIKMTITADLFTHQFTINPGNALVQQSVQLPSIPRTVSLRASGQGIALGEVGVTYNVLTDIVEPSFDVLLRLRGETINAMTIEVCSRWLKAGVSGMAVLEIGVPTGFEGDPESIGDIKGLRRIEPSPKKIILYFDEISGTPVCLKMHMIRNGMVAKAQPAAIRLYDYYEPTNQVTAFYESQLLKNSNVCDVCGVECGCVISKNI